MHIYLVRIPRRKGHSIQGGVLAWQVLLSALTTASTASFELAQTGGISIRPRRIGSNNRAEFRWASPFVFLKLLDDPTLCRV